MMSRLYIKRLFVITKGRLAGLVVSKSVLINTLSCCQRRINDGFNKGEQTEAGHGLECEGHLWPPSILLFFSPSLTLTWHAKRP